MINSIYRFTLLILISTLFCIELGYTQITINESKHFIIGSDTIPTEDANDTLFYYSHRKRALRIGVFNDGKAEEVRLGTGSTSFGLDNQAGGTFSTAFGNLNLVQGTSSFVWGRLNKNYGSQGTVWGLNNEARDSYTTVFGFSNNARQTGATAWGRQNYIDAEYATVFGIGNRSVSPYSLTIGEYNRSFDNIIPLPHDSLDFLFVIGNGQDFGNLSNAMIVNKTGQVGIGVDVPDEALHVNGNIYAEGTITQLSDINSKYDFSDINPSEILEKVSALPLTIWKYKGTTETHIGPMAQDFYSAFGLGAGETTIATVDADGVALAAIKALVVKSNLLKQENLYLKNRIDKIEELIHCLISPTK